MTETALDILNKHMLLARDCVEADNGADHNAWLVCLERAMRSERFRGVWGDDYEDAVQDAFGFAAEHLLEAIMQWGDLGARARILMPAAFAPPVTQAAPVSVMSSLGVPAPPPVPSFLLKPSTPGHQQRPHLSRAFQTADRDLPDPYYRPAVMGEFYRMEKSTVETKRQKKS